MDTRDTAGGGDDPRESEMERDQFVRVVVRYEAYAGALALLVLWVIGVVLALRYEGQVSFHLVVVIGVIGGALFIGGAASLLCAVPITWVLIHMVHRFRPDGRD